MEVIGLLYMGIEKQLPKIKISSMIKCYFCEWN